MSVERESLSLIDAQLYQHLATGNSDGFQETIINNQLNVLKLRHARDKNNVLHIASIFGQVQLVRNILNQWPQLMVQGNSQGDLPMHSALKTCRLDVVDALTRWLQRGEGALADQVLGWNTNRKKNTPLHIALEMYDVEVIILHRIVRDFVDLYPCASYLMNKEGICPLYLAIKKEFVGLVKHMVERMHPFKQDAIGCLRKGKSILHAAVSANKTEILDCLLNFDDTDLIKSLDKQGRTALSYAAYMGNLAQVQILIDVVPHSPFISNKDKSFPIHQAILGGHVNVINLLTSSMLLLNGRGQNVLHLAALNADFAMITTLLNSLDVATLINQKDEDGNTPLDLAKNRNQGSNQDEILAQKLQFILERAARGLKTLPIDDNLYRLLVHGEINQVCQIVTNINFDLQDLECEEDGSTILHIAASMDQPLLVVDILGKDCNLKYQANNKGDLPIHLAAKVGMTRSLKVLIEFPIIAPDSCKSKNTDGNVALHIAVLNNHLNMAKYLYSQCPQAAYILNNDKICPLFMAIKTWGESDIVDDMIRGLDGNMEVQSNLKHAKSIVHMAIFSRRIAILKSIVDKAPSLMDSYDSEGRNPLSYAAHIGYLEGVKLVLNRFPELEFNRDKDKDGSFPIHQAAKGGHVQVIKLLHPKTCLHNNKHQSILHIAAGKGRTNVVTFLLKLQEFEELINTRDDDGNTPLHLAVKGAHYRTVYELTKAKHTDGNSTNNELLTPRDMFELHTQCAGHKFSSGKQIKLMDLMLRRVNGENSILRERRADQKNTPNKEAQETIQKKANAKSELTSRERANTLLVVATLIITVSFAAAFTPPGGYRDNTGIPIFIRSSAFRLFMLCNGFAFIFAVGAALTLILGMNVARLADVTLFVGGLHIYVGILWMSVAFLAGSVDVQLLSMLKPRDSQWRWVIVRRLVEIVIMPVVPSFIFMCRTFKGFSELRIRYLLLFCSEEKMDFINYSI